MMEDLRDLELDSDGLGSRMSGGPQTVRKIISLNLTKKTKLKRNEVKSNKSRKERREKDEDGENKTSRRGGKTSEKRRDNTDDEREDEELDWSHKVMFTGEKVQDPMIHICEKCSLPILIYGRLSPCKHVFCLSCAEQSNGSCARCTERIDRIEPAGIGQIFVCVFGGTRNGISGCRRSYLSQRDLFAHIKHRHEKEGSSIPEHELIRQQGVVRVPFLNTAHQGIIVQPGLNMQSGNPATSLPNTVVLAGMQTGSQQAIVVDANRVPLIMGPQTQFPTMQPGLSLSQSQYSAGAAYIPQALQQQIAPLPTVQSSSRQPELPPTIPTSSMPREISRNRQQSEWRNNPPPMQSGQDWISQDRSRGNMQDWGGQDRGSRNNQPVQSGAYPQQFYK